MLKGVFVLCSEGASTSFLCLPVSENTPKAGCKPKNCPPLSSSKISKNRFPFPYLIVMKEDS